VTLHGTTTEGLGARSTHVQETILQGWKRNSPEVSEMKLPE
jgi:hypothetical protein